MITFENVSVDIDGKRILSNLPPNVETVLFSEENEILLSSIPDFKLGEKIELRSIHHS